MSSPEVQDLVESSLKPEGGGNPISFQNTYIQLPEHFYARVNPRPVASPRLIKLNVELARFLAIDPDWLASDEGISMLAGNGAPARAELLATAYAGHQFGTFVSRLGDGRANLVGEVIASDGDRYDVQLKGSGPTPFSRGGDGRAAIGPVLREYVVSEAMAALGVPTTRALAAVTTGQPVFRETPLPGAVLARVARSHIRIGTFEYFGARRDTEGVRALADYAIARHYPELSGQTGRYRGLLDGVIARQAKLIGGWVLFGFIHGVMNTDNMSISGETIDYGPCAFMESYDPNAVFSSIDRQGRYSYRNQPAAALWNLTRLAEALFPLLEEEHGSEEAALSAARESLERFAPQFDAAQVAGWRRKLGLMTEKDNDLALAQDLLGRMAAGRADFTLTFRRLCDAAASPEADAGVGSLFADPAAYEGWAAAWRARLGEELVSSAERQNVMRRANPVYIPRNHLVENVIAAAVESQDFEPFEELLRAVTHPFDELPGMERYATPARQEEQVRWTFCGT